LIRVSTDKQDVARQRADMERLKKKFNAEIVRVIELQGVSGTATLDDRQVQQVLRELENPDIDGLGLSSLDRLFRPGKRFGQYAMLDSFIDAHKKMWACREGEVDPATRDGAAKCTAAFGQAGAEWRNILETSTDGRRQALEAGRPVNTTPVFGHIYIDKHHGGPRYEIDQAKAGIARDFFGWAATGTTSHAIAARLNDLGIKSNGYNGQPGGLWSSKVVRQMLRNTSYIGRKKQGDTFIDVPRIIDDQTFADAQRMMEKNKTTKSGRPSNKYLLRHYLFCSCGHRMRANAGRKKTGKHCPVYICGRIDRGYHRLCDQSQVQVKMLEPVAWKSIWEVLTNPDLLLSLGRAYMDSLPKDSGLESIEAQLSEMQAHLARIKEMTERRMYTLNEGAAKCDAIRTEIAKLEETLHRAGRVVELPPLERVKATCRAITEGPEPEDYDLRRGVLEGLIDLRMEYGDGELEIQGQVPIAAVPAKSTSSDGKYWDSGINADPNTFACIPFILRKRVA